MVNVVANANGPAIVTTLYERCYVPVSSVYAHGGGVAMLRHVGQGGVRTDAPTSGWLRRSSVHVADGCVGALAHVIATNSNRPTEPFKGYANAHLVRALTPIASLGGSDSLRRLHLRSLPWHAAATGRSGGCLNSETYQTHDTETSEAMVGCAVADMLSVVKRGVRADPCAADRGTRRAA